jgi:hypothetical protein
MLNLNGLRNYPQIRKKQSNYCGGDQPLWAVISPDGSIIDFVMALIFLETQVKFNQVSK